MVGDEQRNWLKAIGKVAKPAGRGVLALAATKIYKGWNFGLKMPSRFRPAETVQKVSVIYGHVHQIQYNQIGNISFNSVMAPLRPGLIRPVMRASTICPN
jgi:hypothetical protein